MQEALGFQEALNESFFWLWLFVFFLPFLSFSFFFNLIFFLCRLMKGKWSLLSLNCRMLESTMMPLDLLGKGEMEFFEGHWLYREKGSTAE